MIKRCPKCHRNTFEVDSCYNRSCNHFEPGGGIDYGQLQSIRVSPAPVCSLPDKKLEHCPDCSARLEHEGGCNICRLCGWSACL